MSVSDEATDQKTDDTPRVSMIEKTMTGDSYAVVEGCISQQDPTEVKRNILNVEIHPTPPDKDTKVGAVIGSIIIRLICAIGSNVVTEGNMRNITDYLEKRFDETLFVL